MASSITHGIGAGFSHSPGGKLLAGRIHPLVLGASLGFLVSFVLGG